MKPATRKNLSILLFFYDSSMRRTAKGIIVGHITSAVSRKIIEGSVSPGGGCGDCSESHTNPSEICCTPKIKGIDAKGSCEVFEAFLREAIPMTVIIAPPAKLASAEKHMWYSFLFKQTC
jgi:hypothetical protein